jgi:hypothetical protein
LRSLHASIAFQENRLVCVVATMNGLLSKGRLVNDNDPLVTVQK